MANVVTTTADSSETESGPTPDTDRRTRLDRVRNVASEWFGWDRLRPGQAEAMIAALEGRDVLAVMPTGAGKSALYQVPAVLLAGPTLVVSPLLALQRDQIGFLTEQPERSADAVQVSSDDSADRRDDALEQVNSGATEFVFLAPEQLANGEVLDRLAAARPSLVAVDEAHCVSVWGHDFRPDYLRIGDVLERLGRPTVVALTATASPTVRDDIVTRLGLRDPYVIVTGFDRPNIHLAVERFVDDRPRRDRLVEWVASQPAPGIVYAPTRRATEGIADELSASGLRTAAYHGGMRKGDRTRIEDAFDADELDAVVATSAFGMGIDKPNVRFVVHTALPDSPDTYYQEIGRAGRDDEPARALLLYRPEDLGLRRYFASGIPAEDDLCAVASVLAEATSSGSTVDRRTLRSRTGLGPRKITLLVNLLEQVGAAATAPGGAFHAPTSAPSPANAARAALAEAERLRRVERSRLEMAREYADTTACRRQFLLGYFGEDLPEPCGRCDTCESGSAAHRDADAADRPWPLESRVRHREWGGGTVMRYDADRVVVLFDEVGYRTLALPLADERDLLRAAG